MAGPVTRKKVRNVLKPGSMIDVAMECQSSRVKINEQERKDCHFNGSMLFSRSFEQKC